MKYLDINLTKNVQDLYGEFKLKIRSKQTGKYSVNDRRTQCCPYVSFSSINYRSIQSKLSIQSRNKLFCIYQYLFSSSYDEVKYSEQPT